MEYQSITLTNVKTQQIDNLCMKIKSKVKSNITTQDTKNEYYELLEKYKEYNVPKYVIELLKSCIDYNLLSPSFSLNHYPDDLKNYLFYPVILKYCDLGYYECLCVLKNHEDYQDEACFIAMFEKSNNYDRKDNTLEYMKSTKQYMIKCNILTNLSEALDKFLD